MKTARCPKIVTDKEFEGSRGKQQHWRWDEQKENTGRAVA